MPREPTTRLFTSRRMKRRADSQQIFETGQRMLAARITARASIGKRVRVRRY
jgi:hypothetical protein